MHDIERKKYDLLTFYNSAFAFTSHTHTQNVIHMADEMQRFIYRFKNNVNHTAV